MSDREWIVEVDQNDKVIGKIERSVSHKQSSLHCHREVMLLLFTDKTHTQFLMQHRSLKKKQLPGFWTLSVTGHVDYRDINLHDSEGYFAAAKREGLEELGVKVKGLVLEGKILQHIPQNWAVMGVVTGEFEGELRLDPEEVDETRVFNKRSVLEISDKLTPGAKACLKYLKLI